MLWSMQANVGQRPLTQEGLSGTSPPCDERYVTEVFSAFLPERPLPLYRVLRAIRRRRKSYAKESDLLVRTRYVLVICVMIGKAVQLQGIDIEDLSA